MNQSILQPALLTLRIAITALFFVVLLALPLARWLYKKEKSWYKTIVESAVQLPLLLPPSVIGYAIIEILGRNSGLGGWLYRTFGIEFLFNPAGAVVAATIVSLPLMYHSARQAFLSVDPILREITLQEGATHWQYLLHIELPLTDKYLLQGAAMAFARACGEFGATLMVMGYIPGKTETLSTALFYSVEQMHSERSFAIFGVIIGIQVVTLFVVSRLGKGQDQRVLY